MRLSKYLYQAGRTCNRLMWEVARDRTPPSDSQIDRMEEGLRVGLKARELYPNALLIDRSSTAASQTEKALKNNQAVIFEAFFEADELRVRPDILVYAGDNTWDLIEVKSKKNINRAALDAILADLAVQVYVVRQFISLRRVKLKHICDAFDHEDFSTLFAERDLTAQIDEAVEAFASDRKSFQEILLSDESPQPELTRSCKHCQFFEGCWPHLPEHNIFHLPRLHYRKTDAAIANGKFSLDDVDPSILNEKQLRHLESYQKQEPLIDHDRLRDYMDELNYPIYYLDFETLNPRIPLFKDIKPSGHFTFQYSLHVEYEDHTLDHYGFLDPSLRDPRPELAKKLLSEIGEFGSIVSHNAGFEKKRIEELAEALPDLREQLLALLPRFWDTETVFKDGTYVDWRLKGSSSIKVVLPNLVGAIYEGLDIQDGSNAQAAYSNLIRSENLSDQQDVMDSLKAYCEKDTEAMYLIVKKLRTMLN